MTKSAIKQWIMVVLFYSFRIFPIQRNKIVVSMFAGKGYCDNGKSIVDRLLEESGKYDIVWLTRGDVGLFPKGVRTVSFVSLRSVYEQCTAKIWIDNRRKPGYVRKRKGQYYINTCHGNAGLKKVEFDVEAVLSSSYIRAAMNDSKMTNLVLSGSRTDTKVFRTGYRYDCEILEAGFPRQDILLSGDERLKAAVKERLGLPQESKVLLYAPTFRRQMLKMDMSVYELDWESVLSALEAAFGGMWRGVARLHPNISDLGACLDTAQGVINATDYPDMGELMLIADCVISDYSSSIVEAGIAQKLGFFFATDIEEYKKDRDFYIPIERFPFPLAQSNNELVALIRSFDIQEYHKKLRDFFYGDYGLKATGQATQLTVERIRAIAEA